MQRFKIQESRFKNNTQGGQILIVLILIMLVGLTVALAVAQRSKSDLSSSTKTEQTSRAFSAAEAGIEQALEQKPSIGDTLLIPSSALGNESSAKVTTSPELPLALQALEIPPTGRADFAQIWLANPTADGTKCPQGGSAIVPGFTTCYTYKYIDVYFGNGGVRATSGSSGSTYLSNTNDAPYELTDKPGIELSLVYRDSASNYLASRFYLDSDPLRPTAGGINTGLNQSSNPECASTPGNCVPVCPPSFHNISTSFGSNRLFYCKVTLPFPNNVTPMLLRTRILYSKFDQRIAIQPLGGQSLPRQAKVYTSVGTSGEAQRRLQVTQINQVVPHFLDFVIFAQGNLDK
jgi:hypothetical protein